ncbi:MAG: ParB/RepB/Spo0J family partition protein [Candidatus Thorarchaeota archaeon]
MSTMKLADIRVSPAALRQCQVDNDAYIQLRDSVDQVGVLHPLLVREKTDTLDDGTQDTYFELVDGLQRYTACQELGIEEVDVKIGTFGDIEALEAQIITNVHKVETKPIEYTKALQRLLALDPMLTIPELAKRVAKSPQWINQRFNMVAKLDPRLLELVNDGRISVTNALQLAKLPQSEQMDYAQAAQTEATTDFVKTVKDRVAEINKAAREGREASERVFELTLKQRKLSEIKAAYEGGDVASQVVSAAEPSNVIDAFNLGIAWVLSVDPVTAAERENAYNEAEALREQKKDQAKKEREVKAAQKKADTARQKAEEAAKVVAELES